MADKRTRSEHFLWQQQRLRENSDRKHADRIRNDRERFYNQRDAEGRTSSSGGDFAGLGVLWPLVWFLLKWYAAYFLWSSLVGMFYPPAMKIIITVIFIILTIVKQVRRFKKRFL